MIGSEDQDGKQDKVDSAIAEYLEAVDLQSPFDLQQWLDRHQEIRSELMEFLATENDFGAVMLPKQLNDFNAAELTTDWARGTIDSQSQQQQPFAPSIRRSKIGPYVLKRLLGAGGMGQVYEASDPSGNLVAVKLLSSRWMRSEESLLRFKQEGEIASTINHPRCVFVRAADEDQGQP
jgi:serine/threonine protein kinase